ncbi:ADP-heptose:LPS heptosyltransferase [Candidatus Scalindua japonica]|uniref:ADP-heptose:LPS heptosyltransferase n=1 Tax=Candidatus Scalindua japonica TaxID=1284222 RepID=A0A286TV74_9BACT|nr:glycosyltransferase family 9 protein [Candidatus Scalindua japonica]GAX59741.1 ADP-heptose:LPS heptosyltransferase [Candidatus Scalindua japonica]
MIIDSPANILIIRLSAIGDVINVLPSLRLLRTHFPKSRITWLVEDRAKEILTDHPDIDEVIIYPRKKWQSNILKIHTSLKVISEALSFYKKLRRNHYDLVIDFQGNLKSAVMNLITGSDNRFGFGKGHCKEFNYLSTQCHAYPVGRKIHRIEKNLSLIGELGIEPLFMRPELPVTKENKEYISMFINNNTTNPSLPIILIHPGTSKFGSFKQWSPKNYSLLANMILEKYEVNIIFTWGPGELNTVKEIIKSMKYKALPACKTDSIKQLIELIRLSSLFIGGDTGPLHIASIMNIPVVGIYGPKDPITYGPYNGKAIVIKKDIPCSPCRKRTCGDPKCMTTIIPDDVFCGVERLLLHQNTMTLNTQS